jgi:cytochrome c-type biogenesis protein CcmH/NrfF
MRNKDYSSRKRSVGLAVVLAAAVFWSVAAVQNGGAAADPDSVYLEVVNTLMSPVCPGKVLQACPSAEGAQLRELVRRKARAGESKEKIFQYFVEVYGAENVLPAPPAEGFYLTAWGLPFAGILAGLGVFYVLVRAWTAIPPGKIEESATFEESPSNGGQDDPLMSRLQRELDEFES